MRIAGSVTCHTRQLNGFSAPIKEFRKIVTEGGRKEFYKGKRSNPVTATGLRDVQAWCQT